MDSCLSGEGWVYDDLVALAKEIETIGFVCDARNDAVLIAGSRSQTGGVISPLSIPIGCIVEYKLIEI